MGLAAALGLQELVQARDHGVSGAAPSLSPPRQLQGRRVAQVAAGIDNTLLLTEHGQLFTCGRMPHEQHAPALGLRRVPGLEGVRLVAVAAAEFQMVAACEQGRAYTWGINFQVGWQWPRTRDGQIFSSHLVARKHLYLPSITFKLVADGCTVCRAPAAVPTVNWRWQHRATYMSSKSRGIAWCR